MQPNKPYLWLDSAATPGTSPTLLIYVPQSNVARFIISPNQTTSDVILTCTADNRGDLITGTLRNYTSLPANTTSVKVILKDGGSILGSCKLRKVASSPPGALKPLVWVGANRVHYMVCSPGEILSTPPNNPSILNHLETITCPNNSGAITDSDNWMQQSFTTFDPAEVAQVKLKVNNGPPQYIEVGETTSNTDDADGSGGNELLDDFFD